MLYPLDDTIAAIASAPGGAARGIVRISGRGVPACLAEVFRADPACDLGQVRRPTAVPGWLRLTGLVSPLECELLLWPTHRSFTGQPVAELHTLGSPPLVDAALAAVCRAGARLAGPGEFTLRAFLAGRLDLTQAEAVLGVIDAADPAELRTALAQLAGGLAIPLGRLRESLLDLLAHLEAGFDFADEDLPFLREEDLRRRLAEAADATARLARQTKSRSESAERARLVLSGWPNTGKSSLFNALTGQARAIVSDQPGTTRDYLVAEYTLGDVRCLLVDTAGIEGGEELPAEEIGRAAQAAAVAQIRRATVRVLCLDSTRPMNPWERRQFASGLQGETILVLTKCDAPRATDCPWPAVETSTRTGQGLAELRDRLRLAAWMLLGSGGEVVAGTAIRCGESLRLAADCLFRAGAVLPQGEELVAAELRGALEELGKVAGAVYTDDLLDRIFSRFCIGK